MPFCYELCGLIVSSDVALPMLVTAAGDGATDLAISRSDEAGESPGKAAKQVGPFSYASPDQFSLSIPRVADFRVQGGEVIAYRSHADEASLATFLYSSALPIALLQRGLMVLNGSVVAMGDRALLLLGSSVTGKTSVAASLAQQGHKVISDGVCVIDAAGVAQPLTPVVKLWRQSAEQLGIATEALAPTRPGMERFYWPSSPLDALPPPLPASHVYSLNIANSPEPFFKPVTGLETFGFLRAGSRHYDALRAMGLDQRHLQIASTLARQAVCAKAFRASLGMEIAVIAEAIIEHAQAHPHMAAAS